MVIDLLAHHYKTCVQLGDLTLLLFVYIDNICEPENIIPSG